MRAAFASAPRGASPPAPSFLCECGDPTCQQRVELTLEKYEELKRRPCRFVVALGHELALSSVVESGSGYAVVEPAGLSSSRLGAAPADETR